MAAKSSWWLLNDDQWWVKLESNEVTLHHLKTKQNRKNQESLQKQPENSGRCWELENPL